MILPAFFARVNPVSTIANPACMKNTKAAPIRNQIPNASALTISEIAVIISFVISLSPFLNTKKGVYLESTIQDTHLCAFFRERKRHFDLSRSAFAFL